MKGKIPKPGSNRVDAGALRIAGVYLVVASLWILFSDRLAVSISTSLPMLTMVSLIKGWVFVLVTALMLFIFIRRETAALRSSEARYRLLNERFGMAARAAHLGVWDWDRQSGQLVWDEQMYQLFGIKPEDVSNLDEAWRKALHPEDAERSIAESQKALAGEKEYNTEYRILWPDGTVHYIKAFGQVLRDAQGQPLRMTGINYDITGQKQAEFQAQDVAKFPDENPNPVMRVSLQGDLLYANQASAGLLKQWNRVVGQRLPRDWCAIIQAALEEGGMREEEAQADEWVYGLYINPILERGYINIYGYDITERKRMENELKRAVEELGRSNSDLEQFAYVASHDLQEPLRSVSGMVQLLKRRYGGQLDERADEYITHAVDGTLRMQTLINDLLAFSRVDRRGRSFALTNLEDSLKIALANLDSAIRESSAVITHTAMPTVWGDSSQLAQIFQNLIGNALKFRGELPPRIEVGAEPMAGEWRLWVRDNGIGIDPQYSERIFAVFQRLHTRHEYPGNGIGLSICKKIVERHGGRIWVESQRGQGATFYFTILEQRNETWPRTP